jgi:signal transduction histidine kinase
VLPVTAVLILLVSAMLGWYATRAISRPFARLDAGAQALARGEFQYEVEVSGNDELAELGRAFNYAAKQLRERKRAEEALRQAQADLAYINRVTTMGELTASLAHEIRQPITAAVTNASTCLRWLSRDQPDLEEARAAASRIVEDLRRTEGIISRICLLFKKGAEQREWTDVNEVIREMIVLLRNAANQYSISIRIQAAENLPRVMADRVQLQQVFMNLMLNGIEAMKDMDPPGELTIKSQAENGELLFSVSDTGVGLPTEQADQIFSPFFTTKPDGTGMGLSISRSIIEVHGGRLWATANSGPAATFHFTLPGEVEVRE